ncbi:MAG: photosystem II protein PsbQ [Oscillatoriaceae cyanobacterium Prado104]|jgi:photosystem II protein PsbQ|nr:photosystem II protein PsbQ [Oscillatoriaceae cyanobacterium Prado104]
MIRPRSIFASIMALLMVFLVSCSSGTAAKVPTTYTAAQVQQIQRYVPPLTELRLRMDKLETLIQKKDWINIRTYIHGPLGDLRGAMKDVSENLLPKSQEQAAALTKSLFADLVNIDIAAKAVDYPKVVSGYQKAVKDFDAFLQLIPQG